jgi:hypothetical protein
MIKRIYFSFIVFIFSEETVFSQKQTTSINQVWLGYFNQSRWSNKWGTWTDLHLRTKEDFFSNFSQSIIRVGGTYYLNDNTKLTAGYAYVSIYPGDNHKNITQPEHRPWQQVQWHTNYSRIRLMQWFRLEERFRHKIKNDDELADGYNFNYRVRYNFYLAASLARKPFTPNSLSFVLNNELHVNFGKEITYNCFDQNRFFVGFAYHTSKTDNLQFGYMNLFQQLPAGNQYKSIHAARLFYFHNLDFRKK